MIRGQIRKFIVCTYSAGTKQVQTFLLLVLLLSAEPLCHCGRKSGDRVPLVYEYIRVRKITFFPEKGSVRINRLHAEK